MVWTTVSPSAMVGGVVKSTSKATCTSLVYRNFSRKNALCNATSIGPYGLTCQIYEIVEAQCFKVGEKFLSHSIWSRQHGIVEGGVKMRTAGHPTDSICGAQGPCGCAYQV
jgi:hypothetical protein